jgi:hypothetical protein
MKKSHALLLKLANKFQNKYAQSQNLQEILQNAAGYGETSANGIMNFPAQLQKDQANLSFTVTISSGMMGGLSVEVSPPTVDPPQLAPNYAKLPEQVKKYLDRHIKDFPQIYPGTHPLEYKGRAENDPGTGIAINQPR